MFASFVIVRTKPSAPLFAIVKDVLVGSSSLVSTGQVGFELVNEPLADNRLGEFGTYVGVSIGSAVSVVESGPQVASKEKPLMVVTVVEPSLLPLLVTSMSKVMNVSIDAMLAKVTVPSPAMLAIVTSPTVFASAKVCVQPSYAAEA